MKVLKFGFMKLGNLFHYFFKNYPETILKWRYKLKFKRKLDLNNPNLFFDKIFWMSLYTDTSLWSELADKYAVRKYVEEKIGSHILNELYGVYASVEEINYHKLPDSFVLKTTNGCTTNILVSDKKNLNIKETNKHLARWMKFHYGEITGQLHYSIIKPQIIAEKFLKQEDNLESSLVDYKFYCFEGKPLYVFVVSDRVFNTHTLARMMYDLNWNPHPEVFTPDIYLKEVEKPKSFDQMIEYSSKLSQPFSFVRVDFYEINGKPVFGEMTFTPGTEAGFTLKFQKELGELFEI